MKKAIMFCGTASGVGKTIIAAGFCRLLSNKGLRVAPFKAQNMSLNSIALPEGGEISVAQALQAFACRVKPDARMNPILIKPDSGRSYLVRLGKPIGVYSYEDYYKLNGENRRIAFEAFDSLKSEYDVVVLEGAGSPAEINLYEHDFVNMSMAEYALAEVFIVGDIDRGGVFAAFKGTVELLHPKHRDLVKGFIINKFRGSYGILEPAFDMFKNYCSKPIVGVVPYLDLKLDEEDSVFGPDKRDGKVKIGVIRLPHMSNFNEFDVFRFLDVGFGFVKRPLELDDCDLVILPGSKNPLFDLEFMIESGFDVYLKSILGKKPIIGICGGYQILGKSIDGKRALGLLDVETELLNDKVVVYREYEGILDFEGKRLIGYEIHHGRTRSNGKLKQLLKGEDLLVFDSENLVIGTYLHGIFNNNVFLEWLFGFLDVDMKLDIDIFKKKDEQLDELSRILGDSLDLGIMLDGLDL
ncbi:cobyric acid synthase [Hippea sp. KM1]|uniref:cobyric acid synthase n=1 Tax=Hippea sp. KM1 TaxID=944481 RepID=UPI00046D5C6B|nr:cobyric acid synthase [Hippea sp. KM1]